MIAAFIDLDLLLDIRGLQFCLARHLREFKGSTRWAFYGKSLAEGFEEFGLDLSVEDFVPWSPSIKPYLKAKATVDWLRGKGHSLNFISFAEQPAILQCLEAQRRQGFVIEPVHYVTQATLEAFALSHKDTTMILADEKAAARLQELEVQAFHLNCPGMKSSLHTNSTLEEFFNINESYADDSYLTWKNCISLPSSVIVAGRVVRGFGRGSSQIGFPTANLHFEEEPDLLPGVYAGKATVDFDTTSNTYPAAISIGWNPQFDIDKRAVEAHILHTFTENIYGRQVTLELTHYLRAETVFRDLAELITAIENDVRLTAELVICGE